MGLSPTWGGRVNGPPRNPCAQVQGIVNVNVTNSNIMKPRSHETPCLPLPGTAASRCFWQGSEMSVVGLSTTVNVCLIFFVFISPATVLYLKHTWHFTRTFMFGGFLWGLCHLSWVGRSWRSLQHLAWFPGSNVSAAAEPNMEVTCLVWNLANSEVCLSQVGTPVIFRLRCARTVCHTLYGVTCCVRCSTML